MCIFSQESVNLSQKFGHNFHNSACNPKYLRIFTLSYFKISFFPILSYSKKVNCTP